MIVGLVGLAFLVATGVTLARVPGWLGTGILAGFLGYVIAASFNNPLLFVRVSCRRLHDRRRRSGAGGARPGTAPTAGAETAAPTDRSSTDAASRDRRPAADPALD